MSSILTIWVLRAFQLVQFQQHLRSKSTRESDAGTDITYSNVSTNSHPMLSEQGVLTEG